MFGSFLILIINLFIYCFIQPIVYIKLYFLLKKKEGLTYINLFLKNVSFTSFLTLILFVLFEAFDGRFALGLFMMPFKHELSIEGISATFLLYSWLISASYFILYFFNKKNKLGIYIHKLLFMMFVFVLFETVYRYLQNW